MGSVPEERKPRFAIFLSGGGSNAEKLLESDMVRAVAEPAVLVTDAPEKSRAPEIAAKYNLPLIALDIREFYRQHGLTTISLATPEGRAVRAMWTDELRKQLKKYEIDFAVLAGFEPLSNITDDYPCLNVHPGDLSKVDGSGNRLYAGLHNRPIELALLAGEKELKSSVIIAQSFTDAKKDMDKGLLLGISQSMPVDLKGFTVEELQAICDRRPDKKPRGGWNDELEKLALDLQNRLKITGDHIILPLVVRDFAKKCFAFQDGQLYYRSETDQPFTALSVHSYTPDGCRFLPGYNADRPDCGTDGQKIELSEIIALTLTAILWLAVTITGFCIWSQPNRWKHDLEQNFLTPQQDTIRAKSVNSGNYNEITMNDLELGPDNRVLFRAPRAVMTLDTDGNNSGTPPVKLIKIFEVKIIYDWKKQLINDIPAHEFIHFLTALPHSESGLLVPLEINGKMFSADGKDESDVKINISQSKPEHLQIKCAWSQAAAKTSGTFTFSADLVDNSFALTGEGSMSLPVLKKLLRNCQSSQQFLSVFRSGDLNNSQYRFGGTLNDWQINNLNLEAVCSNGKLKWYKHEFDVKKTFTIKIQKNAQQISWYIPQLLLESVGILDIKNLNITQTPGKSLLKFSADCDLRQAAVNVFCSAMQYPILKVNPNYDSVQGLWDPISGKWKLTGNTSAITLSENNLEFQAPGEAGLKLIPVNIALKASGTGNNGKLQKTLEFKKLHLQTGDALLTAQSGSLVLDATFGKRSPISADTLEFQLHEAAVNTADCQFKAPLLNGNLSLRNTQQNALELAFIGNGTAGEIQTAAGKSETGVWNGTLYLTRGSKTDQWQINSVFLESEKFFHTFPGMEKIQLNNLTLRGHGTSENGHITSGKLRFAAESAYNTNANITNPQLEITRSNNLNEINFKFTRADFAQAFYGIRHCEQGQVSCQTATDGSLPEKFILTGRRMQLEYGKFSGIFLNCTAVSDNFLSDKVSFTLKFDSLRLNSSEDLFGNGTAGGGGLQLQVRYHAGNPSGELAISGQVKNPVWRYKAMQFSGDQMQFNCSADHTTGNMQLSGAATLNGANISGDYFSALTPCLKLDINMFKDDEASGQIEFAPGYIMTPQRDIELRQASFTLPWRITARSDAPAATGTLRAEELRYRQQNEGSLTATLHQIMLLPDSLQNTGKHELKISGVLHSSKFGGHPINIQGNYQLPPYPAEQHWQITMAEAAIKEPFEPGRYLELPFKAVAKQGSCSFSADIKRSSSQSDQITLQFNTLNSNWQINALTATGVTTRLKVNVEDKKLNIAPAKTYASELRWKKFVLLDNDLTLSILPDGKLLLSSWQGKYMDSPFKLSNEVSSPLPLPDNTTIPLNFEVRNLNAGNFFNSLNLNYIYSDMPLSGKLNTFIDSSNSKLYIAESKLTANTPEGALLEIRNLAPEDVKIRNPLQRDFTLAVLQSLRSSKSSFVFSILPGETSMALKTEGVPSRPVPFVYQGSRAREPFRRAEPGEAGFYQELELNINIKQHPEDPGL